MPIGHLCGVTFCKNKSNNWSKVLITSGYNDARVIPTSSRLLFSQIRAKTQARRCILEGPNPGHIIGDSGDFIPFVLEEQTQFCLFPLYPPPTSSARHADLYSSSMKSVNLKKSGKSSSKAEALLFNPLVTKILLKRSALSESLTLKESKEICCKLCRAGLRKKRSVVSSRIREWYEIKRTGQITSHHRKCGHAKLKNLLAFKRRGKVGELKRSESPRIGRCLYVGRSEGSPDRRNTTTNEKMNDVGQAQGNCSSAAKLMTQHIEKRICTAWRTARSWIFGSHS